MGFGPLGTYLPPDVYSRTLTEANVTSFLAGLRIPVYIGVGQEELEQIDLEVVRGSSSTLDQQIVNEDVGSSWVVDATNPSNPVLGTNDGTKQTFRVRNFPLVDGQGFGRTANDVKSVTVTVNGIPVAVGQVQGAKGLVTLQVPPQSGDEVRITYFFHRGDTSFTDDVSDQVTVENATLVSPGYEPFNIVTGVSDTFTITVNGSQKTVTLAANSSTTATALKSQIDAAAISGLTAVVVSDELNRQHLQFSSTVSLVIGSTNANGPLGFSAGAKTSRNADFRVFQLPIVDGSSGGITTTDTSKVVVKVNGSQVIPAAVDGKNGIVTLTTPPPPSSTVTIQYWANTWQDTFDYLPNTLITNVIRAGISPGRSDYIQNADFVVINQSRDVSTIHWGTSFAVAAAIHTPGAELFDDTQITGSLVDDKWYNAECNPLTDTTVIPAVVSTTKFVLPAVPTTGNGRDTPLSSSLYKSVTNARVDLPTNRPDLIVARVGRNLRDALNRPAVKVVAVDAANRIVTLRDAVPPDYKLYATFWYNRIVDDTYIVTCSTPGSLGSGQYTVTSSIQDAPVYHVRFKQKGGGLTETVNFPRGVESIPDAMHVGGAPVAEIVRVTFGSEAATNAQFTNDAEEPYSIYASTSDVWTSVVNGTTATTTLSGAARGYLVGSHVAVSGGNITIPASPNNVLNLTVDGFDVSVTLTPGSMTPSAIVSAINTAIETAPGSPVTGGTNLCSTVTIGSSAVFIIRSFSLPGSLPSGFDHVSEIKIRQGTVEGTLGFKTFATVKGTTGAVNKPATLLGSVAGPFNLTADLDNKFRFRVNGVEYNVTLTPGSAVSAATLATDINTVVGFSAASAGTGVNAGKLRLMSNTNNEQSSVQILDGSANTKLGFVTNQFASQTRVFAQEIANSLMATSAFAAEGIAYATTFPGQGTYITIESRTVGAAASSVAFGNASSSAFNSSTGVGIVPGTDGDNGEDAMDNFVVSSNLPTGGSAGTGVPGQTYTDLVTGLRFTVLAATDGSYTASGYFDFEVSPTFEVNSSAPHYAIPGLETTVSNTVNVTANDSATIRTFSPQGVEPKNGDFYFISYRYMKQDFSTRIFRQFKSLEANFGRLTAENRVTLGAFLGILNGAVLVGVKQVLKVASTNQASALDFVTAIQELETPLQGNIKPDLLVPLSTDTSVYGALTQHVETMSHIRNQSERMGFIGFASGTSPTSAQSVARGLLSNRIVAFYPDSAVIELTNELNESFETVVDGTFFAAAVAGAVVSPSVDVATPYTRRQVQGFKRIPRIMDVVELNQTATAGITLIQDLDPIIRIRQGLTTNVSNVLTRLPTVTQIADYVSQQTRSILDAFIGTKFLASRSNEVEVAMTSLFKSMVQQEIVGGFAGISAAPDETEPTTLNATAYYQPVFPLLYIILTFNLRAKI